jgi:inward rectifier potassium channel
MDVEARLLLMTVDNINGQLKRDFINLPLERKAIYFFPLTWTVVHPIDQASPLYGKTAADLARVSAEILVLIKAFDDTFSQVVNSTYSYRHDEFLWGAKFTPAFHVDTEGDLVVNLDRINELKMLG